MTQRTSTPVKSSDVKRMCMKRMTRASAKSTGVVLRKHLVYGEIKV